MQQTKAAKFIQWPNKDAIYVILLPQNATDSPIDYKDELIIALDEEIQRLKKDEEV